ncbi:liprin-alpha-2 [Hylaeus volcanicus]|uniref:liprin-alpha-2 n=1 Tax=Hylaeus volcanicus TaxID=313075 RepID=UPI0023B77FC0|nr:liprin-alpha-2 [Hylaeus volcanicus]XP_053980097.1 liprin-alpha-2 [Hylaeus volcanicus]
MKSVYSRMPQAMAETAISPKSQCSRDISIYKEQSCRFSVEKRLARCVRRKFQTYSQLPVRCHRPSPYYRPPRTSLSLAGLGNINYTASINTGKSCPENGSMFHVIGTPPCKKSLSLIDLSQSAMEPENLGDLRSDISLSLEKLEDGNKVYAGNDSPIGVGVKTWIESCASPSWESEEGGSQLFQNPRKAANLVFHVLVLNAWRRRREEVVFLRDTIDDLSKQIKHLHLQVVVLRRLIDTENNRVGKLTHEVHHVKGQLEDTKKERDLLKLEKDKLTEERDHLSEISEERLVTAGNVRNELITAQSQVQALDEQISRDRKKLLKLREDKRILLDKLTASEVLAKEQETRADKADSAVEDLQLRLAKQITLVETTQQQLQQYIEELKVKEGEKSTLEKRLRFTEETGKSLHLRTVFLEAQLSDREATLRRTEEACRSQLQELNELRDRFIRQSQDSWWSSRMLQIAGSVVRVPGAILRTLLSTTGPALTS